MIESLIKDDELTGIAYKIKRMTSVLVGDREPFCERIFKHIGKAYNIRSKFVHAGTYGLTNTRYLPFVHAIVSELLIFIIITEAGPDLIFQTSTRVGFG